MRADNTANLTRAATARTQQARARAIEALKLLDRHAQLVTVGTVSRTAGVSRSFLYRHPDLLAEIDRLGANRSVPGARLPSGLRASEDSRQAVLETLRAKARHLEEENKQLSEQLEKLLGERRAAPRQPGPRS